eukprot:gene13032-13161_t
MLGRAGRFEDPLGLSLPSTAELFCDAWKRAEELLYGTANVPMVCMMKPVAEPERKGKGSVAAPPREFDGTLYAGHESFQWLLAVISHVLSIQKHMKKGDFLFDLIYPKEKDGQLPARSPSGRYRVKLFILDSWRAVTIDDRFPVDLFGRTLLVGSRPLQLWPMLLCKAIVKVMAVYKCLDQTFPHQVAAFQMLTGWPQEDLLDPLGGTTMSAGKLFDRLEKAVGGPLAPLQDPAAVASCCLIKRSKPPRMPPRLVVLTGPSAVGRAKLVAQLIDEFPDKFGVTISHTSRTPKEHEVDGRDYHFTNKHQLLADARAKKFLEVARVAVHTRPCNTSVAAAAAAPEGLVSCWYGTSLATVREVAASGKMCVMSLDPQGAQALRANERIDGLFLYINTSSPALLASRQKDRPAEAPSTMTKRISWAKLQMAKSTSAGLFDVVIPNTSLPEVYAALKEAISTLSPIIRNRLRGLPAYVLDYADLIPPNSVEKPFLKPVVLSGPNLGERRRLLEMLAEEFPDVFAFPRPHTTKQADEHKHHIAADGDELKLMSDQSNHATPRDAPAAEAVPDMQCRAGNSCNNSTMKAANAVDLHDSSDQKQQDGIGCKAPGGVDASISRIDLPGPKGSTSRQALLGPPPVIMSEEDFDAAAANGEFLESHTDLFMHPLVTRKHAHSWDHVREVIKSGKLPLIELEAEGAEAVKLSKGIDSLTIFLAPPSLEVFEQRLVGWATESDEEVVDRQAAAAAQLAAAQANNLYDQVIVNDELDQGYKQLKAVISQYRPDLIPVSAECTVSPATPVANVGSVLLLGPAGGGCEELAHQLLQRYPHSFAVPRKLTDRKPGKGDRELTPDLDYCKPDALAKLVASGQVVFSQPDATSGCSSAVTAEAVNAVMASGKVPLLELGAATPKQLQVLKEHPAMQGAFTACVLRTAALKASLASAGMTEPVAAQHLEKAAAQAQELEAARLVQVVVSGDEPEEALAQLQEVLCVARPGAVPPLLLPVVVAGPFGSGKRAVLQKLIKALPNVIGIPKTVTSKPRPAGAPSAADMEVVSVEVAQEMQAQGQFLLEQTVLGHVYGVTSAAVRKLQGLGKLPLLDLDRVADVVKLKSSGFQATYVYLQAPSLEKLLQQDVLASVGKLSEVLHQHYPSVVHSSSVWGFGRPLWDISCRMHGYKPLKIMVLGPAASGKSTQCALLARKFEVPLVNAGDLLYAEVAAKTAIGLEAKSYTDNSRTVPAELLLKVLLQRLAAPDCATQGWLLDGFPHTRQQGEVLAQAGHVPDKVIMLEGPHTLLLDRVKYRRIDYNTGKVYHMAEAGALSELVRPLKPNGGLDNEVVARLAIRHDDSSENVTTRLTVWDKQVQGLVAAYEDVLLRIPAAGNLEEISSRLQAFVQLEANAISASGSASMSPVVASWELEELTYRVVATVKYQRRQMVQLQQLDGKLVWANLQELCSNSRCLLLAHNPSKLPIVKSAKHLDSNGVVRQQLLVFVVAGPPAAGRRTVANLLLQEFPHRLVACVVYVLRDCQQEAASSSPNSGGQLLSAARFNSSGTTGFDADALADATFSSASSSAPAQGGVGETGLLQDVSEQEFQMMHCSNQLVGLVQHMGQTYAASQADLEAAASQDKAAVVVGPLQLADQLRRTLCGTEVVCFYLDTDAAALGYMQQEGAVGDGKARHNMQDAQQQNELLQLLLNEQQEQAQEEQLQQLAADAAFHMNTSPGTPTGGDGDIQTLLRLRATTSGASMLHLPRGKHVLQLQCSPLLLHCVTFYAAVEYALDEAARLLPSACGLHVASENGDQESLRAGSRHMLFRYLLKPSQPCTATFDLRTSSPALQACSRLLLVNNHNRTLVQHVLNQPSQVPLAPTDKGYTLVCLTEPHVDVPASSWAVSVTSSRPLPPMQAVPVAKPVLLQGTYAANTKVMVARHVLCPTTPVQLALLSQLWCPADVGQPVAAALGTRCPLSYTLQLFDTAGAKEVTWGATYELLAEAAGGADGRAFLPGVFLAPGRYVVVMQLLPDASRQWVDPVSGSTQPAPHWELMCLPSADEKICPISPDDAYERHFRATAEAWQQQTATGSSHQQAAPGSRPGTGSSHANVTNSKPAAAAKDRPKLAQAALERYTAEQQTVNAAAAFVVDSASGIGGSTPGASPNGEAAAKEAADQHTALATKDKQLAAIGALQAQQRLRARYTTNPQQFELLFSIVDEEVGRNDHDHSKSCTKGLLWLKRALEFMTAIMRELLDKPDRSMSDVVSDTYYATLHRWHGFLASSAFHVAFAFCPSRESFMEKVAGADDPEALQQMQKFIDEFSPLLAEVHTFLDGRGLDDPAKV